MRGSLKDPRWPAGSRATVMIAAVAALGALALSCENSDPTAPEGSTITVTASPQTVNPGRPSLITATVRSGNGTRLPDQEVLFNTTRGTLTPDAQTPVITDGSGQATSILNTTERATVTAASGSISGLVEVGVSDCAIQSIFVNLSSAFIGTCLDTVDVTVSVVDTNGQPCDGLTVFIKTQDSPTAEARLKGSVNPSQGVTSASGDFIGTFTPDGNCASDCTGKICEVDFIGQDDSGVKSSPETLGETIN